MANQGSKMASMMPTCLLCAQIASLRARSFLAYRHGMSRHSLRGALHFDLLATAIEHHVGVES